MRVRFLVLVSFAIGCSYESQYLAPQDGRPRAVWQRDRVVVEAAGAQLSPDCLAELHGIVPYEELQLGEPRLLPQPGPRRKFRLHAEFWIPVYVGILVAPPPPHLLPPLLPPLLPRVSGERYDDRALMLLATLSLLVLPAVDVALAAAPAESASSAQAIDQVNALNDLMRSPESNCRYYQLGQIAPAGQTP